jgi:hypothetical protein
MSRTRIAFLPRYNPPEKAASSRMRALYLCNALQGFPEIEPVLGATEIAPDVIVVQKDASPAIIEYLKQHKAALRLFDYDDVDVYRLKHFWPQLEHIDAVLVDTAERKGQVKLLGIKKPLFVLPDCVDYGLTPMPYIAGDCSFCWFGYCQNFDPAMWAQEYLTSDMKREFRLISDCEGAVPWALDTFVEEMRKTNTVFLSHDNQDRAKSANKLVTAIVAGLPAICGPSASYEEIYDEYGLEWAIVRSEADLRYATRRLDIEKERKAFVEKLQGVLWEEYNPKAVAAKFLEIVQCLRT